MAVSCYLSRLFPLCVFLTVLLTPAIAIQCYQCASTDHEHPYQCSEFMPEDTELQPSSCDSVHGAQYCIKLVGRSRVSGWFWSSSGIKCFQCSSHNNLDCANNAIHDGSLQTVDCSHIYGAKYCIKTEGRNQGVYSTMRQCSSLDLGNYCNYVKLQGDVMDYRSCVYTCSSDGCNGAQSFSKSNLPVMALCFLGWLFTSSFNILQFV